MFQAGLVSPFDEPALMLVNDASPYVYVHSRCPTRDLGLGQIRATAVRGEFPGVHVPIPHAQVRHSADGAAYHSLNLSQPDRDEVDEAQGLLSGQVERQVR